MARGYSISDRRLTLPTVLADCVVGAMAFPLAALVVPPDMLVKEATQSVLVVLPLGLLLLSIMLVLARLPEPPIWNVSRAITAGVGRSTLLCMLLLCILLLTGSALPLGLFGVAWGVLALASALIRIAWLKHAPRISV
jgi:hypothetical protein